MPSATYRLIAKAMAERKQVLCLYDGFARAVCPIMLGHKNGREQALTFQFAGDASRPLPAGGQWKCLELAKMHQVELRDGPWHAGASHSRPQGCVDEVDLDVNPASPYEPRRQLETSRRTKPRRR